MESTQHYLRRSLAKKQWNFNQMSTFNCQFSWNIKYTGIDWLIAQVYKEPRTRMCVILWHRTQVLQQINGLDDCVEVKFICTHTSDRFFLPILNGSVFGYCLSAPNYSCIGGMELSVVVGGDRSLRGEAYLEVLGSFGTCPWKEWRCFWWESG